jgi:N-acetyl sugar amidotransferase
MKTLFGLPEKVLFCKKCVISNQRPSSTIEFKHTVDSKKHTIEFSKDMICQACLMAEQKNKIDWKKREEELLKLLDKFRSKNGSYDCIVPGSGGKDSCFQAHILKYKYGMNPLTITWEPILPTIYGKKNFQNWISNGKFENKLYRAPEKAMQTLTRLSVLNLLHPFQTFILGQKNLAPRVALDMGINLIFYGENEAEYGNPIAENNISLRDKSYFSESNWENIYLAGLPIKQLRQMYDLKLDDLKYFLPILDDKINEQKIEVHYLGYYLKWTPQETYYYAVKNLRFRPRPFRTEGTYSKYNSIDDKIDDFHYYTTYIKFGIGRATYDASQEIRNHHITRDEGVSLVKKFDGEVPTRYFNEVLDYLNISSDQFHTLCNQFRSPHLWENKNGDWILKNILN